jgi:tubulin-specific chaperone E
MWKSFISMTVSCNQTKFVVRLQSPRADADVSIQILAMLSVSTAKGSIEPQFPALNVLSIAGNNLASFELAGEKFIDGVLPTVKMLILESNNFVALVPLCRSLFPLFPDLAALSLQHNQISTLDSRQSDEPLPVYRSITSINLSRNAITDTAIISSLPLLFPNLTSLRVSGNPFFTTSPDSAHHRTDEAAFMLTLARLPNLKTLNYSAITDKDRMEGELYYLSVAEKEVEKASHETGSLASEKVKTTVREWARYHELCSKYDRENFLEKLAAQNMEPSPDADAAAASIRSRKKAHPPNSLGARLVTITFHSSDDQKIVLTVPRTFDVYRVKGLLLRKAGRAWGLKPLDFVFELLHDGPEDDMSDEEIPDSTRRIGDWIGEEVSECTVRVNPRKNGMSVNEAQRMDLGKLIEVGGSGD